jgi:hypothetical protein
VLDHIVVVDEDEDVDLDHDCFERSGHCHIHRFDGYLHRHRHLLDNHDRCVRFGEIVRCREEIYVTNHHEQYRNYPDAHD